MPERPTQTRHFARPAQRAKKGGGFPSKRLRGRRVIATNRTIGKVLGKPRNHFLILVALKIAKQIAKEILRGIDVPLFAENVRFEKAASGGVVLISERKKNLLDVPNDRQRLNVSGHREQYVRSSPGHECKIKGG